ncbi:TNFAIP3-interacting protein 2 [Centroberyx gerrardi]|uniref:TNFAIP3-interacting protein 2 isoform X2 n=1 Tax=Centroberyx gerrardi TaxID=166262 RepID=UPI003AAE3CEB
MDNVSITMDNDMLKDRIRSYNTLNTLYHETRQEIDILNKQIYKKDNLIADLKARLGRYERICINVEDNEPVVIGPSKSLLESLCKEICKLKQKRNETEVRASRQAEISQQEIQRLHAQLREKERELESIRCQPDHEKDQEIQRLRSALEERDRAEATRAVLCTSLAEEADQLRGQLGATVKVCQELLARLEREKKGGAVEEMPQQQKAWETTESSNMSGVNAQISQLQEENQQLKQRVVYVEGLNAKWQKYDSSREEYVRGLCQRLKETGALAVSSSGPGGAGPEPRPGPGLGSGLGPVSSGLLHQEISRLNGLLEEKMSECVRLGREQEEIRRRDQERIQTLEQQVLIYTEDFKSERADRERAQGRIQDLKEEIFQLQQQLHKQGASREARDAAPLCRVHIGHRITSRRHKDSAEHLLRSSAEPPKQPAAATPNPAWSECQGLSELQCPRCLTTFDDRDAVEYLNHCEECAKL